MLKGVLDVVGKLQDRPGTTVDRQRSPLQDLDDPHEKAFQFSHPQERLRKPMVRFVEPLARFGGNAEDRLQGLDAAVEKTRLAANKQPQHLRRRDEAAHCTPAAVGGEEQTVDPLSTLSSCRCGKVRNMRARPLNRTHVVVVVDTTTKRQQSRTATGASRSAGLVVRWPDLISLLADEYDPNSVPRRQLAPMSGSRHDLGDRDLEPFAPLRQGGGVPHFAAVGGT